MGALKWVVADQLYRVFKVHLASVIPFPSSRTQASHTTRRPLFCPMHGSGKVRISPHHPQRH